MTLQAPGLAVALVLTGGFAATVVQAQPPAPAGAPFAGQAYAEADAVRGEAAFRTSCSACHGADLTAGAFGPALKGADFAANWNGRSARALLTYIQASMPPAAPGSLPSQAYGDITAYILRANGAAAGTALAQAGLAPAARPQTAPPAARSGERPPTFDAAAKAAIAKRKAKLEAITPVTDAMLARPSDSDWLIWRRTYDALGFSNLKQISKSNVATLGLAWSWNLPQSQNETTPLVHDGVMFVASGNEVQALDAATGDLLWRYVRPMSADANGGRDGRAKSLAIYQDRLFVATPDKHMVALDIHTGALAWDAAVAGPPGGPAPQLSSGPIVARGKVVIGVSLGLASPGGCFIVALDAATGKEAWRFHTLDQNPPGQDSWNGAPVKERYGGGVWTSGSYDPARRLLFFGVGNTYNGGSLLQPKPQKGLSNDGLYTDATLALDPDTGKLVWHYQHMQRDVWDMDWAFEQTLATLPIDGEPRDVVVTGGKIAIFDVMDRATGQYLYSKDLGLQNLVTAIDPRTGRKTTSPALEPVSGKTMLLCPASNGARNWPTTSLNPNTHILYVPMIESCSDYTWTARSPEAVAKGGIDIQYPKRPRPDSDGKFGRITAVNIATGKEIWTRRQRTTVASSMLATAGGLVFNGALDRSFSAFDEMTGDVLWETRLSAAPSSSPITYEVGGEQYLAVVAGGGGAFDTLGRLLTPEIDSATGGTTVMVFKLAPERR